MPLVPGLNKTITETTLNSGKENKAFKTDSDRREKVAQRRALFKMAVPSTSATPSPTTATESVTQNVTAKLLVVITSLKPGLEALLAREPFPDVILPKCKYSVFRTDGVYTVVLTVYIY